MYERESLGGILGEKCEFGMWVHLGGVERMRPLDVSDQWSLERCTWIALESVGSVCECKYI